MINTVNSKEDVTPEGARHIRYYLQSLEVVAQAKHGLRNAEAAAENAEAALAQWLAPSDFRPNEKIGVWYGDSLFQVESIEQESWPVVPKDCADVAGMQPILSYKLKVTVRTRGKHFSDLNRR